MKPKYLTTGSTRKLSESVTGVTGRMPHPPRIQATALCEARELAHFQAAGSQSALRDLVLIRTSVQFSS
jgi:hypothetical protein